MDSRIELLNEKANWLRNRFLEMVVSAGKGHMGGALSCVEILTILYYGGILRHNLTDPSWSERDRFILSKGHSCEILYVILADLGFISFTDIDQYQKKGGRLCGHPDRRIPGIEADTGSLGHGLGISAGMALAAELDQQKYKNVVLLSDGECCEGSTWEAAMFAGKHKLKRLIAIVDNNGLCVTDPVNECMTVEPLAEKFEACGWHVVNVDGHDYEDLFKAFKNYDSCEENKPFAIIARTIKGKGISFMENSLNWHHGVPKGELLNVAKESLMNHVN